MKGFWNDLPLVSIIIPTYNSSISLTWCLRSIIEQEYSNKEIIVVDDGSTDDTAESAMKFPIQLIRHKNNKGAAIARNSGIRNSKGKILVFIDADCVAKNDWLKTLIANFENKKTSCVVGRTFLRDFKHPKWLTEDILPFFSLFNHGEIKKTIDYAITANFGIRKKIIDEIGFFHGLPTKISYNEDLEFAKRIARAGYKIVYEPNAIVWHEIDRKRISIKWLIRRAFRQGIADFLYKMINLNIVGTLISILRPLLKLVLYLDVIYLMEVVWAFGYFHAYLSFRHVKLVK